MIATISDIATTAPWAFGAGLIVGFVVGARYRIEKRNGKEDEHGE